MDHYYARTIACSAAPPWRCDGEYRESVDLDFLVSDVGSYGIRFVRYDECCLEESQYSPAFAGQAQDELLSFYVNILILL